MAVDLPLDLAVEAWMAISALIRPTNVIFGAVGFVFVEADQEA